MSRDERSEENAAAWAIRLSEAPMDADQQAQLGAWLDADPRHGEWLDGVIDAWEAAERYADTPALVAMREEALTAAREPVPERNGRLARGLERRWYGWAIAAVILLCLIGGSTWYATQPSVYSTGRGERHVVVLDDGSRVSLDAATIVKVKYDGNQRRLWVEEGRAKFDVAKDSLRPFSVSAQDKVVVATGTSFSVEMIEDQVRVILYEGHVAMLESAPRGKLRPVPSVRTGRQVDQLFVPGSEVILTTAASGGGTSSVPKAIDPARSSAWEGGMMVFEDEPIELVIARANRYGRKPMVLVDPSLSHIRVSGVFRSGETAALLEGLRVAFGVRSRTTGDVIELFAEPGRTVE